MSFALSREVVVELISDTYPNSAGGLTSDPIVTFDIRDAGIDPPLTFVPSTVAVKFSSNNWPVTILSHNKWDVTVSLARNFDSAITELVRFTLILEM